LYLWGSITEDVDGDDEASRHFFARALREVA